MTTRVLALGDAHTGLKVGLMSPTWRDQDGKKASLGKAQQVIWRQLQEIIKLVDDMTSFVLIIMGDCVHGPSRDNPRQMDAVDGKTQADIFVDAIGPIAARAKQIYVIDDGSRFHVDDARWSNDYIAQELGAFGKRAYPALELRVEGLTLWVRHHGPALGYRPHTRGDPVRRYLRDVWQDALADGKRAPDISLFAHWHQAFRESIEVSEPQGRRTLYAYFAPALCAADWRTLTRVPKAQISDIGAIALDIDGEHHTYHRWFSYYDNTTRHEVRSTDAKKK